MRVAILGSSGQIGAYLTEYLTKKGHLVREFDIVNGQHEDMTHIPNPFLRNIIMDSDFVFFLAFDVGGSHYLKKYQHTYKFIDNNTRMMTNVFGHLSDYKKPFVFASSQMSNMSYSPYGSMKRVGELYTKSLNGLIVKFWNVFGIENDMEKAHVITDFIRKGFETGVIDMMTDGTEKREFLYAEDCCEALETIMVVTINSILMTSFISLLVFLQVFWELHKRYSHYSKVSARKSRLLRHRRRMKYKKTLVIYQTHTSDSGGNRKLV